MKTLEDLEMMDPAQLRGIAQSLGGNPAKNMAKAKLVQLVYDLQQPEPEKADDEADKEPEKSKDFDIQADLDAKLQEIADHYEGEIEPTEEEKDGATVFIVSDVAGDEVAKGTFHELYDHIKVEQAEAAEAASGTGGSEAAGLSDVPLSVEQPEPPEAPPVGDEDNLAQIERGLKPLAALGLRYSIEGSVIELRRGQKVVSTTANQPAHRVIRTAESLCNFR